jgi:hypothetical protein
MKARTPFKSQLRSTMVPSSIAEATADSCVFLTGVTGFVGGCLLERICRMEPGPARVFVLVRGKNLLEPDSRLKKILASPVSLLAFDFCDLVFWDSVRVIFPAPCPSLEGRPLGRKSHQKQSGLARVAYAL